MAWALSFTSKLWYLVIDRDGLFLDTRLIPGRGAPARDTTAVYLLLRGSFASFGATPFAVEDKTCMLLTDEQLEGEDGARTMPYRAGGATFTAVQLNLPTSYVRARPAGAIPTVEVPETVWAEAQRCVELSRGEDDEALVDGLAALARALVEAGIVSADIHQSSFFRAPVALRMLWKALRPMIERFDLLPTSKQMGDAAGLSARSVERHIAGFVDSFGHLGAGWRAGTRHIRVKMAIMLLSADGISVADVASAVGYGSADAMARAFRDAGVLAPTQIRDKLRST